ncbi:hypothetical protein ACFPL7_05725 [Dongia soli]|uniref:Uncharacterized protein n=1 Tax=Dongia soli TaxID=600628 RepID=A0ABU5EHD9_9PROT|nr:hypothetical protein [Dongia soli]MDY0884900.1 hypothetical protein [Dongia soli]
MAANVALATQREKQTYLANQRQLKTQAKDILDRGGSITSIPYQTYIGIDPKGREAIDGYAKAGGRITTDPATFYRLRDEALDHPQSFLDTDLNDYIHLVDGKDMSKLSALQATLKDKGPNDPAFSLQRSYKANTDRVLQQLGLTADSNSQHETALAGRTAESKSMSEGTVIKSADDDDLQMKIVVAFRRNVDIALSAHEAATGRQATPPEQQQIVNQTAANLRRIKAEHEEQSNNTFYSKANSSDDSAQPLLIQIASGQPQTDVPEISEKNDVRNLKADSNEQILALNMFEKMFVTDDIEKKIKKVIGSATMGTLSKDQINDIYDEVLDNIDREDAERFVKINPNRIPMILNKQQMDIIRRQIDALPDDLRDAATKGLDKALQSGQVNCPDC